MDFPKPEVSLLLKLYKNNLFRFYYFQGKVLYELAESTLNKSYHHYQEGKLDQFTMIIKLDECMALLRESRQILQLEDKISFEGKIQIAADQLLGQVIRFKDHLLDLDI